MTIQFHSFSSYSLPFFKEIAGLSVHQKKIAMIASIAFGFMAVFLIVMRCHFKAKLHQEKKEEENRFKEEKKEKNTPKDPLIELVSNIPALKGLQAIPEMEVLPYDEGLKVRTFSLELLSNIEDCISFDGFKEAVKYFLEHGALRKQAKFSDFLQLIEILKEGAKQVANEADNKKLLSILKKHSELVDLQKNLPKAVETKKKSRWDQIRIMVRSGLLHKDILKTADQAKNLGLKPIPALPEAKVRFNLYSIADATNLLARDNREGGRWIMNHLSIFTFQQLCQSIKKSCHKLREDILKFDDYYLLSVKGKSQEWMMNIAYRYLPQEKLPKGILTIGCDGGVNNHTEQMLEKIIESKSNHFMMFDDATYTGTQLTQYLDHFKCKLTIYFAERESQENKFLETKNIYFIYGASPKNIDWKSIIEAFHFEEYGIKIHFITSHLFENIEDLMNKEDLSKEMREKIINIARGEKKSLITTEWKTPDFVSIPMYVNEGFTWNVNRGTFGELNLNGLDIDSVRKLNGLPPIPQVTPPYRKTKE